MFVVMCVAIEIVVIVNEFENCENFSVDVNINRLLGEVELIRRYVNISTIVDSVFLS